MTKERADDARIVNVGLTIVHLGEAVIAYGRARRQLSPADRSGQASRIVQEAVAVAGTFAALIDAFRAEARAALDESLKS